ncbi:unnamed protein product, partial [Amoebophrya sp. A25]
LFVPVGERGKGGRTGQELALQAPAGALLRLKRHYCRRVFNTHVQAMRKHCEQHLAEDAVKIYKVRRSGMLRPEHHQP